MNQPEPIIAALKLPCGARFYRCALQVNPFEYVIRHNRETTFANESEYNASMMDACQANNIEVISVTDGCGSFAFADSMRSNGGQ